MSIAIHEPLVVKISSRKKDKGCWAEIQGKGFFWKPVHVYGAPLDELGKMSPADAGFLSAAPAEVRKTLAESKGIEIELPADEVAALNWETLSPTGVIRRSPMRRSGPIARPKFPIRMAILTTESNQPKSLVKALPDLLRGDIDAGRVVIDVLPVKEYGEIERALLARYYDVVHLTLPTLSRGKQACARVGQETVALKRILEKALSNAPRLAFFHAATEDISAGISGLRISSQAVDNLGTACILHAASLEDAVSNKFIEKNYEAVFHRDGYLFAGLPAAQPRSGSGVMSSVAAPAQRTSLLEFLPVLDSEADRNVILEADLDRAKQRLARDVINIASVPKTARSVVGHEGVGLGKTVLSRMFDITQANTEISAILDDVLKEGRNESDKPDQERYPVGNFYYCAGDKETDWNPIPENHTLREAPSGRQLEFHFWIDPIKGGIKSVDTGVFSPKDAVYPIRLRAQIWTDERTLVFASDQRELEVPAKGPSKHARFVLKEFPKNGAVEFFLFLLDENGSLVGAFQIRARFCETVQVDNNAQLIVQLFSSSNYFRFPEKPGTSALTILFDKAADGLRVFTLSTGTRPWARLGIAESSVNDSNREIYKHLTRVALDAAASERNGQPVSISDDSMKDLADKGFVLLQDLFKVSAEKGARTFIDSVLALEPGSNITIATTESAAQLIVPWGLLYLDSNFRDYPYLVSRDSFLGYKYNVVVRPSIGWKASAEFRQPVRVGTAWLSRAETKTLKDKLDAAQTAMQIQYEPVKAKDGNLPQLNEDFDLIHFYCHGHTRFPNDFHPEEFIQLFRDRIQTATEPSSQPQTTELREFLQKVANAGDSLMQLDGGFVYRSDLADKLDDFKRSPIVLLSMCESAQVTSSGAGFVTLFLNRGARAAMGTEGPTLWSLGRDLDIAVITRLLNGESIGSAFFSAKREMAAKNPLALIYSLWGDRDARIAVRAKSTKKGENT
jgi:CHAT domain